MEFTLQELYDFANICPPGENQSCKIWNTEKGNMLIKISGIPLQQHFLIKKIYGNMAQRYSGIIETDDYNISYELYLFLSQCKFPFGYKMYLIHETFPIKAYKVVLQKEDEPLQNMEVKAGIDYYHDLPDYVHRPPYHKNPFYVDQILSCTLSEYYNKFKNNERWILALKKLRVLSRENERKNLLNYLNSCTEEKIREIYRVIIEEIEDKDFQPYIYKEKYFLIEDIKNFIMQFDYYSIKCI
jgi:hypothetical protein